MREFRFGFNVSGLRTSKDLAEMCRSADTLGYHVVLSIDHLTSGSPFTPLAIAAEASERLRIGTLTINNEFWNPAMLAREAVTLDHLSGGRFELGLGAGHMKWEFDAADVPWRPFAERVDRLGETIHELYRLFSDGVPTPESAERVRRIFDRPKLEPIQRHGSGGSGPPLLIGGTGDRVLTLAAEHADIAGIGGMYQVKGEPPGTFQLTTAAKAEERVAFVRDLAGPRAESIEFNVLVQAVVVTTDRRRDAETLVAERAPYLSVDEVLETPFVLIGTPKQMADQLRENRERFGFSYITVHEPYMKDFGQVIQELA
ncbi:TIGR03621 family F420-dependent LLM class oxidoreductase [Phytoactinopolyspora limicola]|uniref:TIGR03621 family F420-dependent LLM class oxidoreductase n=1 Tax=Phytoactinopolyspora limicola TaxID=2715536 RepID=UPI0014095C36|nr:TIGR03621 family F420-dependent LLM class oxidoreductase [Phytoactinopolyspora limicola]